MSEIPHGTYSAYSYWKCRCDVCTSAKKARDRAYYQANRDRRLAVAQTYFEANRPAVLAKNRRYYAANAEALRGRARDYARDHSAEAVARVRDWRKTPIGRLARRLDRQERRAARPMSTEDRRYAALLYSDPCSYCGEPGGEVDHITPVAAGGDGHWTNLTSACRSCNARKYDRSLIMFLNDRAA